MLKKYKRPFIHIVLFVITLATTTLAGADWTGQYQLIGWDYVWSGLNFSITFLGILTVHEFGHYYYARKYNVDTSLPYYIPFYFPGTPSIGTFGAFIRMKGIIFSRRNIFDIGIAGPLAGFVAALLLMIYGFIALPEKEYIYSVHPDYATFTDGYEKHVYTYEYLKKQSDMYVDAKYSKDSIYYAQHKQTEPNLIKPVKEYQTEFVEMAVGNNLLLMAFEEIFAYQGVKIPNHFELFHYPFLFAAFLALFFTALNLMPIGQLDGGHVIYGLFGSEMHKKISGSFFTLFVFVAGLGMFKENLMGINFFTADAMDQLQFAALYIAFLYTLFARMYVNYMNAILAAVTLFTLQFLVEYVFPEVVGFSGWLLYAFLIGRFLGVFHPPTLDESPLDLKRKVLGWLSLAIFILCFTPEVITFHTITK